MSEHFFHNTAHVPTLEEWLVRMPLVMGADGEGEGGGEGEGDGGGTQETGGSGTGGAAAGLGTLEESGDDGGTGAGNEDDGYVRLTKAEAEQLRKENAAFKRKAAEAERQAKRDRETQAAAQGRWEELAQEREVEAQEAADRAEAAEYELDRYKRKNRVISIAQRLGFRDPSDAVLHLTDDDTEDDQACERALISLAKKKKYLVNERMATGGASGGNGSGTGLSMDEIKRMTPDEINARWTEVQRTMTATGN